MEDEDHMEDLQEVKTSLAEFLLVLLASPKHGVLFHDPELGCEKSANPLITEVPVPYMFQVVFLLYRKKCAKIAKKTWVKAIVAGPKNVHMDPDPRR